MTKSSESLQNSHEASAAPDSGGGFLHDLWDVKQSALNAAIQQPLTALTQVADGLLNKKWNPILVDAPSEAKFGLTNPDWYAQQVGSALGMVVDFKLLGAGVKGLSGESALAEDERMLSQKSFLGMSTKQAALTGFGYGALLTPSSYKQGDRLSFLESRGLGGLTSAATFTAFSLAGIGFNRLGATDAMARTGLSAVLKSSIGAGILSGIPAGAVSSEMGALTKGHATPKLSDLYQNVYSFSVAGGIFGAADRLQPAVDSITSKIQDHASQIRPRLSYAADNMAQSLFPSMQPAFAVTGDRLAATMQTRIAEDLRPRSQSMMSTTTLERTGSTDSPGSAGSSESHNAIGQAIEDLRRQEPQINNVRDHQAYVHKILQDTLNDLTRQGKIAPGWNVHPVQMEAPADMVGIDYMLVNENPQDPHYGQFHILDVTANSDKVEQPSQHNVPKIGEDGLIYFEKRWIDSLGKLKTSDERFEVQRGIADLQRNLPAQLTRLTQTPSPLKLGEVPLPSIMTTDLDTAKAETQRLSQWLRGRARSDSSVRPLFNDWARNIDRGTRQYLDKTGRTTASPEFSDSVGEAADRAIVRLAVSKLTDQKMEIQQPKNPTSNVSFHGKSNALKLEYGGTVYDGGDISDVLQQARVRVLNSETTQGLLTKGQWSALREKFPGRSESQIAGQVTSQITNMKSEIAAGGALGEGRPVLIDAITAQLKGRQPEALLGQAQATPDAEDVEVPVYAKAAADQIAQTWREEGFPKPKAGEPIDTAILGFMFDMAKEGSPAQEQLMLDVMFQQYQANDPIAVKALDQALRQ